MIVQTYFPQKLSPSRYDSYLAAGWFRGSVMLYKMDLLCVEDDLFSVVNIRLNLAEYSHKKRMRKLLRRNNKQFRYVIKDASIDQDRERLYQLQKGKFKGFIHNTLRDYLNAGFPATVFDTKEVAVYEGERLVAVSYFDVGQTSIASLLGLYDEDYNHYSLGKYTMLLEIEYALLKDKKLYYPGYVLDKKSSFNYKLQLGDYEFYNKNKRWVKYDSFRSEDTLAWKLKQAHEELKAALEAEEIKSKTLLYPYFSMGYMNFWNAEFVRFPLLEFLKCGNEFLLLSFDIESMEYKLVRAIQAKEYEQLVNMDMSKEYTSNSMYLNDLMLEDNLLAWSDDATDIARKTYAFLHSPVS